VQHISLLKEKGKEEKRTELIPCATSEKNRNSSVVYNILAYSETRRKRKEAHSALYHHRKPHL
jgi:hypothetical protein